MAKDTTVVIVIILPPQAGTSPPSFEIVPSFVQILL